MKKPDKQRNKWKGPVELTGSRLPRRKIQWILFDFDGTLSLIRAGWVRTMLGMFLDLLPRLPGESREQLESKLRREVDKLTGKPTIHQMVMFAEMMKRRGKRPLKPVTYKWKYLKRLEKVIASRKEELRRDKKQREKYLVHDCVRLLEYLKRNGFKLVLASGTDHKFVVEEARLLGVARYFGRHIYGALDDKPYADKRDVIDALIRDTGLNGRLLLGFGDGYVEIQETKAVGGIAIAVPSDEHNNGQGRFDPIKRRRLLQVNPDVLIADFRDAVEIVQRITGKAA